MVWIYQEPVTICQGYCWGCTWLKDAGLVLRRVEKAEENKRKACPLLRSCKWEASVGFALTNVKCIWELFLLWSPVPTFPSQSPQPWDTALKARVCSQWVRCRLTDFKAFSFKLSRKAQAENKYWDEWLHAQIYWHSTTYICGHTFSMSVWLWLCRHACMHRCVAARGQLWVSFLRHLTLLLLFLIQSFTGTWISSV